MKQNIDLICKDLYKLCYRMAGI